MLLIYQVMDWWVFAVVKETDLSWCSLLSVSSLLQIRFVSCRLSCLLFHEKMICECHSFHSLLFTIACSRFCRSLFFLKSGEWRSKIVIYVEVQMKWLERPFESLSYDRLSMLDEIVGKPLSWPKQMILRLFTRCGVFSISPSVTHSSNVVLFLLNAHSFPPTFPLTTVQSTFGRSPFVLRNDRIIIREYPISLSFWLSFYLSNAITFSSSRAETFTPTSLSLLKVLLANKDRETIINTVLIMSPFPGYTRGDVPQERWLREEANEKSEVLLWMNAKCLFITLAWDTCHLLVDTRWRDPEEKRRRSFIYKSPRQLWPKHNDRHWWLTDEIETEVESKKREWFPSNLLRVSFSVSILRRQSLLYSSSSHFMSMFILCITSPPTSSSKHPGSLDTLSWEVRKVLWLLLPGVIEHEKRDSLSSWFEDIGFSRCLRNEEKSDARRILYSSRVLVSLQLFLFDTKASCSRSYSFPLDSSHWIDWNETFNFLLPFSIPNSLCLSIQVSWCQRESRSCKFSDIFKTCFSLRGQEILSSLVSSFDSSCFFRVFLLDFLFRDSKKRIDNDRLSSVYTLKWKGKRVWQENSRRMQSWTSRFPDDSSVNFFPSLFFLVCPPFLAGFLERFLHDSMFIILWLEMRHSRHEREHDD